MTQKYVLRKFRQKNGFDLILTEKSFSVGSRFLGYYIISAVFILFYIMFIKYFLELIGVER